MVFEIDLSEGGCEMIAVDSGHFLLTAINSAEDVSLFLNSYNACTADDVLRSSVVLDDRPLVILGSEKRHMMCKKKLPSKFAELGLEYREDEINFVTEDTLKVFVTERINKLKQVDILEEEATSVEFTPIEKEEEVLEDPQEQAKKETSITIEKPTIDENIIEDLPEEVNPEPVVKPVPKQETVSGLCSYGVPKLQVEYLTPNTLGLQESLFVNVKEEDINNFFQAVKGRVLGSIAKDK